MNSIVSDAHIKLLNIDPVYVKNITWIETMFNSILKKSNFVMLWKFFLSITISYQCKLHQILYNTRTF